MEKYFQKVGPINLMPGVTGFHFWSFMYAAFICIAMLAGMNFLQIFVLDVNLALPKSEQGGVTGLLAFYTEAVALLLIIPSGALADRIGRRPVLVGGLLFCGAGYALFSCSQYHRRISGVPGAVRGRSRGAVGHDSHRWKRLHPGIISGSFVWL